MDPQTIGDVLYLNEVLTDYSNGTFSIENTIGRIIDWQGDDHTELSATSPEQSTGLVTAIKADSEPEF